MSGNVLPLHPKQTFRSIIWIFTEGEVDGTESRLPFKIFSTLILQLAYNESSNEILKKLYLIIVSKVILQVVSAFTTKQTGVIFFLQTLYWQGHAAWSLIMELKHF